MPSAGAAFTEAFYADPVRNYMLPVFSDRRTDWPSHPFATRDSLHEHDMWAVEGLTHRYPTKVLAEMLPTCPQYCGHCTRMDLVGNSTPQFTKLKLAGKPVDRYAAMLDYLHRSPEVRDVVVSGGDVANMPWKNLEGFLDKLLEVDNIRDIRLATKALMGLPQHWLQDDVVEGVARVCAKARSRGVSLAIHTHVNSAQSVTPLVAKAARAMLDAGVRDVRNQGVLMRGVNDSPKALLDLCFALQDEASITPYYFYMCDMIPFAEHWRLSLKEAQDLQQAIMGYLPGFATPRIVCDVPVRRQALGAPGRDLRDRARDVVLAQALPHLDRGRRRLGPVARVRLLRPDLHPARGRSALVAREPRHGCRARGGARGRRCQPRGIRRRPRLTTPGLPSSHGAT